MKYIALFFLTLSCLFSCSENTKNRSEGTYTEGATTLFTKVVSENSNIRFENRVREDLEFNFLNYPYLYAGAGVAVGDIDNDGFQDIYLVSNFGPNKLYRNKGDFRFEDITAQSKTEDQQGFSTGTAMIDINSDGWLDIYVCKAGSLDDDEGRRNLLFINNQDGTFSEKGAQWGLDDPGYSTQVYPVDYDKDGDMDIYVVNYRYDFRNNTRISSEIQKQIEEVTSDQLYRNDGDRFSKVTGEAGLYNKAWGLAAAIGDFNNDGWDDIYVCNDYLEPDMLYINQTDGTFRNEINSRLNHISFNSMGSDFADLNNDLQPDLITLDMLAENYARSKENMASMSTSNFMKMVEIGYHHAYMANMLYFNLGNGKFQETGQMSGVVKTDWSWAPLIADFDNDGLKDIFISNGIFKDYNNQDFQNALREKNAKGESMTLEAVVAMIPSQKLDNYVFKNNGDLTFTKMIKEWGLEDPNFSNGAAYADFDNDGDLDLIVNNVNDPIGLYRNNANNNYLEIKLTGSKENLQALGTEVFLKSGASTQYQRLNTVRGYQSSVTDVIHFGMGDEKRVEEVTVVWPDGKITKLNNPKINSRIDLNYASATPGTLGFGAYLSNKQDISPKSLGIDYEHRENQFNDFSLQLLLPQKQSSKGSGIIASDVNEDGLEDFFVGNAAGSPAALYRQNSDGTFSKTNEALWSMDAKYEDAQAIFFDSDSDGDPDLYVVSAGYELDPDSPLLQDRLYINDGNGNYSRSMNALPVMLSSGKTVVSADYDADGDLDLFVGGNVVPGKYPLSPRSYLLTNDNGIFTDALSPEDPLANAGMISDAEFSDYDRDGDPDLLLVGEWMAPTIFTNYEGKFERADNITGLEFTEGWWFDITAADFDGDGDDDYVLGNIGKNNKFQPKKDKPIYIYAKDFDENGTFDVALSKINDGRLVPVRGKECSSEQNPFLLEKIGTYKEFASLEMKDIYGEDKLRDAFKLTVHMFESVYLENLGGGNFTVHKLPNEAQTGPTLATVIKDFNKDGNLDIMGIGAIYDAEVETIRYDSNFGYVLLGDGKHGFRYSDLYKPFIDKDAKDVTAITINNSECFAVVSNNAPLEIFSFGD